MIGNSHFNSGFRNGLNDSFSHPALPVEQGDFLPRLDPQHTRQMMRLFRRENSNLFLQFSNIN